MTFDLIIANARMIDQPGLVDIGIRSGHITRIAAHLESDGEREDADGMLAFGGFVESHIHLDKAGILDRCSICEGTLAEAVAETARAKAGFTEADVYARAAKVLDQAIVHGTMKLRSFVEVDPRAGFRSLEAILRLRDDYRFAVDLEICAFAQEGLTNEPETLAMLEAALQRGADLVGGCPYTDPDPGEHIRLIFELGERHQVPVDFHIDFDLDAAGSNLPRVIAETLERGFGGRVSIGHATKLSAMTPAALAALALQLAAAGISLTVLPATDLFLMGRGADRLVPRGMAPAHLLRRHGSMVRSPATTSSTRSRPMAMPRSAAWQTFMPMWRNWRSMPTLPMHSPRCQRMQHG
jgi:cytosine deaminase